MRQIKAFVRSVAVDNVVKALEAAGVPGVTVSTVHVPLLQAALVLGGQGAALWTGWMESRTVLRDSRRAVVGFAPTAVLITVVTWTLLWLYTG